jgi:hypothetical protein
MNYESSMMMMMMATMTTTTAKTSTTTTITTSYSKVGLGKLVVAQQFKKFLTSYETRRFMAVFKQR